MLGEATCEISLFFSFFFVKVSLNGLLFNEIINDKICHLFYVWMKWISACATAWKVSVFGVILVRIFPHSDWIRRDPYLVQMLENTDQNNSEYGNFLRSVLMETFYAVYINDNIPDYVLFSFFWTNLILWLLDNDSNTKVFK